MLIGITPFFAADNSKIMKKIRDKSPKFPDREKYKINYSDEIVDLINKLLNKDHEERFGSKNDMDEVLKHPFFDGIDKEMVMNK